MMRTGTLKKILDAQRFAQCGSWEGTISIDGADIAVTPDTLDRLPRPVVGHPPVRRGRAARPPGRPRVGRHVVALRAGRLRRLRDLPDHPGGGRRLPAPQRLHADLQGRPDRAARLAAGSRRRTPPAPGRPRAASSRARCPTAPRSRIELESLLPVPIHVGGGYGGDSDWGHGQWKGPDFTERRHLRHDRPRRRRPRARSASPTASAGPSGTRRARSRRRAGASTSTASSASTSPPASPTGSPTPRDRGRRRRDCNAPFETATVTVKRGAVVRTVSYMRRPPAHRGAPMTHDRTPSSSTAAGPPRPPPTPSRWSARTPSRSWPRCPRAARPTSTPRWPRPAQAFDHGPWPRMTPEERIDVVQAFSSLYAGKLAEMADLITLEMGSPTRFSNLAQSPAPWMQIEAFLGIAREFPWEEQRQGVLGAPSSYAVSRSAWWPRSRRGTSRSSRSCPRSSRRCSPAARSW